jgi:hypothetical protein
MDRLANESHIDPWQDERRGADVTALHGAGYGFLGSKLAWGQDPLTLAGGSELHKPLQGLSEGLRRLG